jgi:hypothetical protein
MDLNGRRARFSQLCPSSRHDALFSISGNTAGHTKGQLKSSVTRTTVTDCHGKPAFISGITTPCLFVVGLHCLVLDARFTCVMLAILCTAVAGSPRSASIAGSTINVAYEILTPQNEVVAYVPGAGFDPNNFRLVTAVAVNASSVATWQYDSQLTRWRITVVNTTHPASDPTLLALIAAQRQFTSQKGSDVCNAYFYTTIWVLLAAAILLVILVAVLVIIKCRKWLDRPIRAPASFSHITVA